MKKNRLQTILLTFLLIFGIGQIFGQSLACNDQVNFSLDVDGVNNIYPEDILEGGPYDYSNMQVFNEDTGEGGDFLTVDCDDIGSFVIKVVDTTTDNMCWGNCTVEDKLKPVPYANNNIIVSLNGGNSVTVPASAVDAGSFDNCSIESVTLSPSTFTANGTYTSTLTITDPSGNSDFASVLITVVGGVPVCNESIFIALDFIGQAVMPGSVFVEGGGNYDVLEVSLDNINFGETVTFDCDDIGGSITVYVHIEQDGNEYNCTSEATIEDKLAPIVIAQNFTIDLESETDTYSLTADEIDGGSFDNCSDFTLSLSQTEFTNDDWGQNQVILTGTDVGGNFTSATSIVTVLINGQAPPLQCISLSTVVASPWGVTELWGVDFVLNGGDFDQVLASLDPAGPFTESFDAPCGINGSDPLTVYIKASVGQVEYECFVELTVVDNSSPVAVAATNIVLVLENGSATLSAEEVDNGSYDACTNIEISIDQTMFTTADIGVNQVWLTVTDENGNYNQTWSFVTVIDDSGCTLTNVIFPNDIEVFDENGTDESLSIENLQSIYGYAYEDVYPYTVIECESIYYTYADQVLNSSYGFKILRTWTALDWLTTEVKTEVQILKLYTNYNTTIIICNDQVSVSVNNGPYTILPEYVLEGGPYNYDNMELVIINSIDEVVVDNIITADYIGETLYYTVTDITTGNSCWGNLNVQDFSGEELIITAPTVNVVVGSSICVPITVENFIGVQAGSGTILWDPAVISYTGLSNPILPGVENSLNATNTSNGELKFIWSNPDPANPLSLPNGEEIFELCFDVVGNMGDMSPITLSTLGSLGFEWFDDNDGVIPQVLLDGKVTITGMPCSLNDEDVNYPLANIYLPEFNLDPDILTPNYLVENYGFLLSDVLITWPDEDCLIVGYSIEDDIFDYGNGSFKIVRTITVIDWNTYEPGTTTGIWTFTQVIETGIDQSSLICDILPRTAEVGDCDSGHTLDDDVEWPGDIEIADYRISPADLVEFSGVDLLDSEPSFYNNIDDYEASYVDLVVELTPTSLVIGRVWTVTHILYGFTWTYIQTITIDITDFDNLVTVNTGTNRAMAGVMFNDEFSTNMQGVAYIDGEPIDNIEYEDEYLNGLNVLDIILIQRHILGLGNLSEYGELAADVNHDDSVKASDLSELRKRILGVIPTDKGEWSFYAKDVQSPITVMPKGVFVGVKSGDVDDSVILPGEDPIEPTKKFEIIDVLLNKGESYSVPVYLSSQINAYGIEFRAIINNDLLEVVDVYSDYEPYSEYSYHVTEEGHLVFLIGNPSDIYELGGGISNPVLTIEFEAKENSLLSLAMDMNSMHSYLATSDLDLIVLGGAVVDEISTGINSQELSNISVYPNPTSEYLNIDLRNVSINGDLEVSIYELNGQKLSTNFNTERIDVSELNSGMYFYQIKVGTYTTTGKFMVIK